MSRQTIYLVLVVALIGQLAWVSPAAAGGLYVAEFATSDMGAAGSGSLARGGDAASAFANPATMTRLDSHQLQMGMAPGVSVVKFDQDSDTPVPGGNGGDQGGFIPLIGSSYVHKVSDRIRAGLGLFSISGAALSPGGSWAGRRQVTDIQLFSLSFVPTAAYQVTDWLSVGLGTTALMLAACSETAISPEFTDDRDERLVVYAVNYPLAWLAERIGGEFVAVVLPWPADVDPAFWSPDAETVAAYQRADLIILNGGGIR